VSLIKKQKDILSHDPLVSIFSNNDLLTISVDTDSEDLNRQPKNIKIPNADLKELTIQISGFDTLENNDVGRYFTCSSEWPLPEWRSRLSHSEPGILGLE